MDFGESEEHRALRAAVTSGTTKTVFAITEPDAGSNTLRLATKAEKDGAEYYKDQEG